ncbi:MAG: hypothetical protein NVV59_00075 [Chitinophagaceae bacterium]|nr:hypothetical protein [Chitinophagaceae bacterium]
MRKDPKGIESSPLIGFQSDYTSVSGLSPFAAPNNPQFRSLYNGNIGGMTVNNAGLSRAESGVNALPLFYRYDYDQLNRIVRMRSFKGLNTTSNVWTPIAIDDYAEDIAYDPNGNILKYLRNGAPELGAPMRMDSLRYYYYASTNQLKRVTDSVAAGNYTGSTTVSSVDIDHQDEPSNYVYDAIGNLIEDKAEGLSSITWNVYGKIKSIVKADGTISYAYDAAGNRIAKMFKGDTTIYVRDASGNVLSVYERKQNAAIEQIEIHLYGSSRLGMITKRSVEDSLGIVLDESFGTAKKLTFTRGEKIFELSNHLGNVLTTVSDKRIAVNDGNDIVAYYEADVVNANDYYPFGMVLPGRNYTPSDAYRYGFNGKENDNEVKGEGNQQDYGMRIYDPRVGRFLSVDILTMDFPWYAPYQYAGNMPIQAVDLDGAEPKGYNFNHPYVATRSGTAVTYIPSTYDGKVYEHSRLGLVTAYAVQDIDKKCYLIFQSATGAKKKYWYREYDKDGWKGNVNGFKWSTPPDASEALTAIIFIPMVALPGAVAVGTTGVGTYILKELGEEAFEQVTGIPVILDPVDIVEQAFKRTAKKEFKESAQKQLKTFFKK